MRTITTTSALFLAALTGWLGCGSTVVGGTGGSASAGGVGGSTASTTGPTSTSSVHASSASSASSGGTGGGQGGTGGGQGGTGGGQSTCGAGEKLCGGDCVSAGDPAYGCTQTGCAPCAAYPNASPACMAGACVLGFCDTGFKNCDGVDANGCEADVLNDPANCGACGGSCAITPHTTPMCFMGTCPMECEPGWTDCNNDPTDGCEANLQNDPMNCGSCGAACSYQTECYQGQCGASDCSGTAHCPGDPFGVCATLLGTNENCNSCGDVCNLANATSQCEPNTLSPPAPEFVCALQGCNAGYADCDMIASNGCEVDTQTDPANCGGCGHQCPTPACSGGTCM